MALKALMLRKKLDTKKKELETLRTKDADFEKREKELEESIEEAETEEEKKTVEEEVEKFEGEKAQHDTDKADLEKEIGELETELAEAETEQRSKEPAKKPEERKKEGVYTMRKKFFGMTAQERDAFLGNEEVKGFLERVRQVAKETRGVTGGELLIPNVVLELVRENVTEYSKLYKHVNVKSVPGKARQNVAGSIPEAVWTEACGILNEMNFRFYDVEVDGYKVGGFIPVHNAILEDSDINLSEELIAMIGRAIGVALDKAILYGTGTKMPMGIVTRLTQALQPESYSTTARPWENLSASNVIAISGKTDAALFKEIVKAAGAAKGKYSTGKRFWAMNEKTHMNLVANAMSINAAGAVVSGIGNTMPVVGGVIEELEFIPDDVIIGGFGDLYMLAERAGTYVAKSEHVKFIEDQTVFKGTARYDGIPVIAEGFVAIGIGGAKPTAGAVTFAADGANA